MKIHKFEESLSHPRINFGDIVIDIEHNLSVVAQGSPGLIYLIYLKTGEMAGYNIKDWEEKEKELTRYDGRLVISNS